MDELIASFVKEKKGERRPKCNTENTICQTGLSVTRRNKRVVY